MNNNKKQNDDGMSVGSISEYIKISLSIVKIIKSRFQKKYELKIEWSKTCCAMVDAERIRSSNVIELNRNYTHEHTHIETHII